MIEVKDAVIAPDFTSTDAGGRIIRLSDFRGKKHVVMVFNRGLF